MDNQFPGLARGRAARLVRSVALSLALTIGASAAHAFTFGTTTDPSFGNAPYGNIGNFTTLETVQITTADVGQSFERNWFVAEGTDCSGACDGASTLPFDIAGSVEIGVVSFSSTELVLDVWVNNEVSTDIQAALMSFGFGIDPNGVASIVTDGDTFDDLKNKNPDKKQGFPGGFKSIDICIFAANRCSGGNINNGLQSGESDYLRLSITPHEDVTDFGSSPTVTLAAFPVKFQTYAGSFEVPSGPPDDPEPPVSMSEPGTLALAALGIPMALWIRRRRRSV